MNPQDIVVTGSIAALGAAKLLEFDIHYLVDSLGSGGEFIK